MTGLDGAGMTDCMICLAAGELIGLRVVDLDRKRLFKISVADGEETYAIEKLMTDWQINCCQKPQKTKAWFLSLKLITTISSI